MSLSQPPVRRSFQPFLGLALVALLLAPRLGVGQTAPAPAAATPTGAVITNVQTFWSLSNEEKTTPQRVRFDLLVLYYDPAWQLLWGECEGMASYLPVRGSALPIRTGQWVRIEGTVVPARGLLTNELTVTVLREEALPTPKPVAGALTEAARFDAQWVVLEGYVCRQSEVDRTHILYEVLTEDRLVSVRLQVGATERVPQLLNNRVRFHGVYVADRDPDQKVSLINLWVPRIADMTVLGELAQDARFQLPLTPLDGLPGREPGAWVRVAGEVRAFQSGQQLTLRDESGQITIKTPQPGTLQVGDRVEVVGRVAGSGIATTLGEAHFRPRLEAARESAAGLGGAPRFNLRMVDQILDLPVGEVSRGYAVTLRGVVTWADPRADFFYLQDGSGGICVWRGDAMPAPAIGDALQVRGVTTLGRFAPEVRAQSLRGQGVLTIPPPRPVTLQQALTGAEEARWVELRGYLRQVVPDGDWARLDLTTVAGELSAFAPPSDAYSGLVGAIVNIAGVCSAEANSRRQVTDLRLWVPGPDAIRVAEPAPADPFAAPHHTLTGLKQFTGAAAFNHRVTIAGVVLAQVEGRYLVLQEGESGLLVYARDAEPHDIGETLEVSGLPGFDGSRLVLREAKVRHSGLKLEAVPLRLDRPAEILPDADACLVRVRGHVTQVSRQADQWRITLQAGDTLFDAFLAANDQWDAVQPGTEVDLTGIYFLEYDESHRSRAFHLQLRQPGDLHVVALPPWWTAGRALAMAGGLAVCAAAGFGWVVLLRRRVRAQTEQIRVQLEKEARLQTELERSARLESLGVLAGGIAHDFNNLLTAILGNLGLAAMDQRVMAAAGDCITEAERGARRARDITQQLLTFAKGGDPVRTSVALPEIVAEAANFARHGANVRLDLDFPANLPPGNVDAGQISRVVHNLVINAVQAMPQGGVVSLALAAVELKDGEVDALAPGSYLRLTISDTGRGIPADVLPKIFDPYFSTKPKGGNSGLGLATVRSIVKKHGGHIEVQSEVGQGTAFRIWLPAAPDVMPGEAAVTPRRAARLPARILVMDDEDVIRRVAGRMLALAGHETVVASDGAEAVRAYLAARQSGRPFDLAIFDLTVPGGMGGKEALQELLKADPDIRAIASSGYSSDPVMANPRAFGFCVSLPKPYDIPELTRAVEEARRV